MFNSYSGVDGGNTYAANDFVSKRSNQNPSVITNEQGSASTPVRHTHREGLLQSIGSALYRTIPWISGSNNTYASAQNETQSSVQTTSHLRTSRALPRSSLFSPSEESTVRPSHANYLNIPHTQNRLQASSKPSPRTKWGSLNLGPPTTPSLASRIQFQNLSAQPTLPTIKNLGESVLGKRDVPMADVALDDHTTYTPSARKRRMLWDPEMGFVDTEDVAAHRPTPPPPQNEAERILRALESMRTPLGDARREKLIRSRSVPSWHSTSIPVPLPTPEREGILAPPRSPAFHSISPHMRSLSRSQRLRQSLMGTQPNMSSKLRESLRDSDILQEPPRYVHVDDELAVEELEKPERRSKREARKAEIQPKRSRAKILKTSTKKVGVSKENSEPAHKSNIHDPNESDLMERPIDVGSRRNKFQVRKDNEPGPSRSVLRQNSVKTNRRHAPSGRITAFDDDDDDNEPMPNGEELAKIKLPEFLFPSDFEFDALADKPDSKEPKIKTSSLIERMEPKHHAALSTTPAKEPAAGTVRFDLNSSTSNERSASSFFSTAPHKPTDVNSLSKEKNSGPVPDFFGKSSKSADMHKSASTSQFGLASAFGTQTDGPEVKERVEPTLKKRERDDEEPSSKKPFSFNASDKPTPILSTSSEKKDDKPAFSFGQPAEKKEDKPAFSFGQPTEKKDDKPAFSFGQPAEKKEDKPAFSFGTSLDKPVTSTFGALANKPTASFGQTAATPDVKPVSSSPFSFGSTPASDAEGKPSAPSFSFGASTGSIAPSTTFSFGRKDDAPSSVPSPQPAFSFGATGGEASSAPPFSFGQPSSTPPVSFGSPAPPMSLGAASAQPPASTTSFSFGAPTAPTQTTSFTFGSAPPSGTFQFGANAQSNAGAGAPTTSFSFGAGAPPAAPSFTFGSGSGGNSPATGSPAPFTFGTPTSSEGNGGGNGLFNLGLSPAPAGRQIKPLRQSRRRN